MRAVSWFTLSLLALAGPLAARAEPPRSARVDAFGDPVLPEESRWLTLVRLVEGRWRSRTEVVEGDAPARRRQLEQCIDDAWYLALPSLVREVRAPCNRIAASLRVPKQERQTEHKRSRKVREHWHRRFADLLLAPTLGEYRACASAAADRGDPTLLAICSLALRPRATVVVALEDDERFRVWLTACKRGMLGELKPSLPVTAESAPAPPVRGEIDEGQSRHCLRTLPTLYEIQWLRKLGDFWTPEEQRVLYQRMQELGEN